MKIKKIYSILSTSSLTACLFIPTMTSCGSNQNGYLVNNGTIVSWKPSFEPIEAKTFNSSNEATEYYLTQCSKDSRIFKDDFFAYNWRKTENYSNKTFYCSVDANNFNPTEHRVSFTTKFIVVDSTGQKQTTITQDYKNIKIKVDSFLGGNLAIECDYNTDTDFYNDDKWTVSFYNSDNANDCVENVTNKSTVERQLKKAYAAVKYYINYRSSDYSSYYLWFCNIKTNNC